MRVAIDATPLSVETGGIRRYTEELQSALSREFPCDTFELVPQGSGRWWSYGLPRVLVRGRFDVFHGTDFAVPYVPVVPSVMTVHDLSPWKKEEWRAASTRVRQRTPWLLRLGLARMVVTPTEAVRREVIEHFGLAPDRVTAVPLAAHERFRPTGESPGDYFLMVGTVEPRKNVHRAIAAWRELRRRGHSCRLKLVGRNLLGLRDEPGLELLGAVPDEALPGLYSRALALLLPSHYEGFGLPMLEAFQCGTPVIASRDPALMEVSGGAAMHPGDDWPAAMEAVLARAGWSDRGLRRAADFSWAAAARRMRGIYAGALVSG